MIHDYEGDVVATNVTDKGKHGMIYLVLVHDEAIQAVEEMLDQRGFILEKMPDFLTDEREVPFYFLSPTRKTMMS